MDKSEPIPAAVLVFPLSKCSPFLNNQERRFLSDCRQDEAHSGNN